MAQFSHSDFGGMSQWSPGMSMVGDMYNTQLKSKLDALCSDLAAYLDSSETGEPPVVGNAVSYRPTKGASDWWPAGLGTPGAVGAQNNLSVRRFFRGPSPGDRRPRRDHGLRHRIPPDLRRRAGSKRRPNPLIHKPRWTRQGLRPAESCGLRGSLGPAVTP
jgi:hypothetical protein